MPVQVTPHYVGQMNDVCPHCAAMRFANEPLNCCHNGKVQLPDLSYPDELKKMLTDTTSV